MKNIHSSVFFSVVRLKLKCMFVIRGVSAFASVFSSLFHLCSSLQRKFACKSRKNCPKNNHHIFVNSPYLGASYNRVFSRDFQFGNLA